MSRQKSTTCDQGPCTTTELGEMDDALAVSLRALGHPVRLSILRILSQRQNHQCCCNDVTDCLTLAQSTVSQHIKVLLDAGIVERQARGTRNCYTVCTTRLNSLKTAYDRYMSSLDFQETDPDKNPISESA